MTTEEAIDRSNGLLGLAEKLARTAWIILAGIAGVAVWVYATNSTLAGVRHDVDRMAVEQQTQMGETVRWRSDIDKTLARIIAVQESQNNILNRHQAQWDALPLRPVRTQ